MARTGNWLPRTPIAPSRELRSARAGIPLARIKQPPRAKVPWLRKDLRGLTHLDDAARVHDGEAIRDLGMTAKSCVIQISRARLGAKLLHFR